MFEDYPTDYTPDLNVGLDNLILGETTISSPNIISGEKLNQIVHTNFTSDEKLNQIVITNFNKPRYEMFEYYPKEYYKAIFKEIPILKFDTPDHTLTEIYCVINNNLKNDILELLKKRFGDNRNSEWKMKGIYRTEIKNKYGIIHILYNEFEGANFETTPFTTTNILALRMWFNRVIMTKIQFEKARQNEVSRISAENKIKTSLNKLFDIE